MNTKNSIAEVPISQKSNLTIAEAAAYFNIGKGKLYQLTDSEDCDFVLFVGSKRLIKRVVFERYLEKAYSI